MNRLWFAVRHLRQIGLSQTVIDRLPVAKLHRCKPKRKSAYKGVMYARLYRRADVVAYLESSDGQAQIEETIRRRARRLLDGVSLAGAASGPKSDTDTPATGQAIDNEKD